jgi:hypothetical protein
MLLKFNPAHRCSQVLTKKKIKCRRQWNHSLNYYKWRKCASHIWYRVLLCHRMMRKQAKLIECTWTGLAKRTVNLRRSACTLYDHKWWFSCWIYRMYTAPYIPKKVWFPSTLHMKLGSKLCTRGGRRRPQTGVLQKCELSMGTHFADSTLKTLLIRRS